MKEKIDMTDLDAQMARNGLKNDIQGYPVYPPEEDIYIQALKDSKITPEDISKSTSSNKEDIEVNDTGKDLSDIDLDIPGSELDDAQENIGSEDEENNYYSLGGDNHNNLEEENGD
ncbi:MAG: hypothetical protein PHS30_09780 [Bacteroidales bacterium]|nr:hypothetical protein [Bacteroidales bacterium]